MPEPSLALRGAFLARPALPKAFVQSTTAWTLAAPAVVLMALIIFLPIPFGNLFPAVSLLMLGLGLLTRDGLMMGLSVLLGLAGLTLLVLAGGWIWSLIVRFWSF